MSIILENLNKEQLILCLILVRYRKI